MCRVHAGRDLGDLSVTIVVAGHGVTRGELKSGIDFSARRPGGDEKTVGHGTSERDTAPTAVCTVLNGGAFLVMEVSTGHLEVLLIFPRRTR